MSQADVDIARRCHEAWVQPRPPAEFVASDAEFDGTHLPDGRIYHGLDEIERHMRTWTGTWKSFSSELEDVADAGDGRVLMACQHGIGKGSGAEVEIRFAMVWTIRDGKIVHLKPYNDRADASACCGARGLSVGANADPLRRAYEAFNARDVETLRELVDSDIDGKRQGQRRGARALLQARVDRARWNDRGSARVHRARGRGSLRGLVDGTVYGTLNGTHGDEGSGHSAAPR